MKVLVSRTKPLLVMVAASLILTGCGTSKRADVGVNMACASVESYLETKAITLSLIKSKGSDPVEVVQSFVGGIPVETDKGKEIQKTYLEAMTQWAKELSAALSDPESSKKITQAAVNLESRMDVLEQECKANGWSFENNWRG